MMKRIIFNRYNQYECSEIKRKKLNINGTNGITLVALVITIVVLLILAGITITMLFGENGIIKKAQEAAEATQNDQNTTEQGLKNLADQMNAALDGSGNGSDNNEEESIPEGTYSIDGVEPSPMDLFYYEPISTTTGKLASTEISGLPEKKARITGIKEKYCNSLGWDETYTYIDENGEELTVSDTNYEIIYNGTKISDILVVPYKVKIGDEYYTVTEVDLKVFASNEYGVQPGFPRVKTIIYPNTVETIEFREDGGRRQAYGYCNNYGIKNVILSKNLKNISVKAIYFITGTEANVWVPKTVTYFGFQMENSGDYGFASTSSGTIRFEGSEEDWYGLFNGDLVCGNFDNIKVEFNCAAPTTLPTTE